MKKYSCYIPAVLILLLFCSLLLFRGSLIRYASRIMTDGMEPEEKSIVENILSEQYDYGRNKNGYEYTFLEFGSVGCIPVVKWNPSWMKSNGNTATG